MIRGRLPHHFLLVPLHKKLSSGDIKGKMNTDAKDHLVGGVGMQA